MLRLYTINILTKFSFVSIEGRTREYDFGFESFSRFLTNMWELVVTHTECSAPPDTHTHTHDFWEHNLWKENGKEERKSGLVFFWIENFKIKEKKEKKNSQAPLQPHACSIIEVGVPYMDALLSVCTHLL